MREVREGVEASGLLHTLDGLLQEVRVRVRVKG
jgi:hypothetical protein